jgi:hypothetical protein
MFHKKFNLYMQYFPGFRHYVLLRVDPPSILFFKQFWLLERERHDS